MFIGLFDSSAAATAVVAARALWGVLTNKVHYITFLNIMLQTTTLTITNPTNQTINSS